MTAFKSLRDVLIEKREGVLQFKGPYLHKSVVEERREISLNVSASQSRPCTICMDMMRNFEPFSSALTVRTVGKICPGRRRKQLEQKRIKEKTSFAPKKFWRPQTRKYAVVRCKGVFA